jgi:hypothetical protein
MEDLVGVLTTGVTSSLHHDASRVTRSQARLCTALSALH